MDCLDLQPFLLPVPICYGLDCLEVVLDEVQQSDRILLIDDDHSPLGVIATRHLLGYLRDPQVWRKPLLTFQERSPRLNCSQFGVWAIASVLASP